MKFIYSFIVIHLSLLSFFIVFSGKRWWFGKKVGGLVLDFAGLLLIRFFLEGDCKARKGPKKKKKKKKKEKSS